ncbi:MAG TPA: hypothetical protein VHL79_02530 [Ramlibacter sp.]|jgi:hypothetical protein|nr:hypothetical protein [Ramlibacter sp.]
MRILAGLLALACAAGAHAQACPHASEVRQPDLLGLWRAEIEGAGHVGTLLLEKHEHYAESFSGVLNRNGDRRPVAGDVEDGEFTMEESADGVKISALWLGELVEGSCGKEIRGTWTKDGETAGQPFILRKQ